MGAVWAATHTGLGQAVAIKFISKEFVTSPEALRRFDAEAKAAAQLRSKHVVQVFDNGTLEDGTPYIAMELLRGENVYARVHRAGPVPLSEAIEVLWQCCKALGRAHAAGIIHRDIKPDNIFLAQSGDEEGILVKVLDFGIAKFAVGPERSRVHANGGGPRDAALHEPRAGPRAQDHRPPDRPLFARSGRVHDAHGQSRVLERVVRRPLAADLHRAASEPVRQCPLAPGSHGGLVPARVCARSGRLDSAPRSSSPMRCGLPATAPCGPRRSRSRWSLQPGGPVAAGNLAHAASVGTASGMSRSGDLSAPAGVPRGRGALVAAASLLAARRHRRWPRSSRSQRGIGRTTPWWRPGPS